MITPAGYVPDKPLAEYFLSLPGDRDVNLSGVKGDVTRSVVEP
jgi:hypothetical protein